MGLQLYLVRHTRVAIPNGTCYGQIEVPLKMPFDDDFQRIAQRLKAFIKNDDFRLMSSPLSRCQELARYLTGDYTTNAALMELSFGDWEGRLWKDIPRAESEPWTDAIFHQAPPNGESYPVFSKRIIDFYEQTLKEVDVPHLVFITHAGVIRCLRRYLEGISKEDSLGLDVPYGSVYKF